MLIFLDLDGVIHSWNHEVLQLLNLSPDDKKIRDGFKNSYDFLDETYGASYIDKLVFDQKTRFWRRLEPFYWAKDLYKHSCKLVGRENVYFLTSFGYCPAAATVKAKRVKKEYKTDRIILTRYKYLLADGQSILIDDKPSNIREFNEHGGNGFLWPSEFAILDGEIKVDDLLDDLTDLCEKIKETCPF